MADNWIQIHDAQLRNPRNTRKVGIGSMSFYFQDRTPSVRLDPLIPDVTDTPERLLPLLAALSRAGVREAAASHIFLRRGFGEDVIARILASGATPYDPQGWSYQAFDGGCTRG